VACVGVFGVVPVVWVGLWGGLRVQATNPMVLIMLREELLYGGFRVVVVARVAA
jgi:hypothetical protein